MLLVERSVDPISVQDEWKDNFSGMAPELSNVYQEMERVRALHLDVSDVILSYRERVHREWIPANEPDEHSKL